MEDVAVTEKLSKSAILTLVKNKLHGERIKLWLPPYSNEDGTEAEFTQDVKKRFSEELGLPIDEVVDAVDSLRTSSLERLQARNQFLLASLATLKIKVTTNKNEASRENIFVETKLDALGGFVRQQVAQHCKVQQECVKLIAGGRIIADDLSLELQRISVTTPIMAIIVENVDSQMSRESCIRKQREDAEILANRAAACDYDDDDLMQITDQNNKPINIPKAEKKSITLAMILNERGKSAMHRRQFLNAIVSLLEADKEFQKCGADILKLVDNYALLCMDIAWCYLCLGSIEELPDAENRLLKCEEYLHKSYGPNMERVMAIKGTTGAEAVLFLRLKLLKGIAAFHRCQWKNAEICFTEVESELKKLTVDDQQLIQVLEMGYSTGEARVALRSCGGNVTRAVDYLITKAAERKKLQEEAKKMEILRKFGKTMNGQWVNADFLNSLVTMGYKRELALEAIKLSNNDVSSAIETLQNHVLNAAGTSGSYVTQENINMVMQCGFTEAVSTHCLKKHNGNVEAAIMELVSTGGIILNDTLTTAETDKTTAALAAKEMENTAAIVAEETEAFNRLKSDISNSNYEESYLDLTLEDEFKFLNEYKDLLKYAKRNNKS